jgi:hypothetical protein
MADNTDYFDECLIRHRKDKYVFFIKLAIGVAIMLFTVNHVPLQTLITLLLSSIGFGGILGYVAYKYEYTMCKREIEFWRCRLKAYANWGYENRNDAFVNIFRVKWYSWLCYLLFCLIFFFGLIIQMSIFRHSPKIYFAILFFAMALLNLGSMEMVKELNYKNIILKLKAIENES